MYIGSSLSYSLLYNAVNKLNNRCILNFFSSCLIFLSFFLEYITLFLLIQVDNTLCLLLSKCFIKKSVDIRCIGKNRNNLLACNDINIIHGKNISRISHGNSYCTRIIRCITERNKCVLSHNAFIKHRKHILTDICLSHVNKIYSKTVAKCLINILLCCISKCNNHFTKHLALLSLS